MYFYFLDLCTYKKLESTAMDEGNLLADGGYTDELGCERLCNDKSLCKSFGYCPAEKRCYLYDKMIDEGTEMNLDRSDDCRTHYRSCGNLNFVSMFHL